MKLWINFESIFPRIWSFVLTTFCEKTLGCDFRNFGCVSAFLYLRLCWSEPISLCVQSLKIHFRSLGYLRVPSRSIDKCSDLHDIFRWTLVSNIIGQSVTKLLNSLISHARWKLPLRQNYVTSTLHLCCSYMTSISYSWHSISPEPNLTQSWTQFRSYDRMYSKIFKSERAWIIY